MFLPSDYYFADLECSSNIEASFANQQWSFNWNADGDQLIGETYWNNLNPDGIGIFPEVAVGRVPVDSPEEFISYITKVVNYEKRIQSSGGHHKVLFISNLYDGDETTNRYIGENILGTGWNLTYLAEREKQKQ